MTEAILNATHRCDSCGAQAYVRALFHVGEALQFCLHHWRQHEAVVRTVALDVLDETYRLLGGIKP